MSLSALHKHLIRRTFKQLAAHHEETLTLFEQRLRELNPALLPLFVGETGFPSQRLMEMLALLISLMDDPAALSVQLKAVQTQQRHRPISGEQWQQAGCALLWVIEQRLGDAYTGDIQMAWLQFFQFLVQLSVKTP